ncbi:TetR/AcrR family transcriptional regulator [Microbacterium sp. JZ31]|uniref:TetR/AcrR family transcriptional regulator n=1 Tax=Microbacterium sp. JZ31 TaxID=1906274 RepID=UPI0019335573|nr:TetR/AcrR family transcriptional regulator [Microbacterium sp. JZ31]
MTRPPHAREKVLDAFEQLLIREGERAATLESVAREAGVSKGGLLYHFGSREALEQGLFERLRALAAENVEELQRAPEGPLASFLATSGDVGLPVDRAINAVSRLAHGGNGTASAELAAVRAGWAEALRPHVRDDVALDLVMLVSDGIYVNSALMNDLPGPVPRGEALAGLIRLVQSAVAD